MEWGKMSGNTDGNERIIWSKNDKWPATVTRVEEKWNTAREVKREIQEKYNKGNTTSEKQGKSEEKYNKGNKQVKYKGNWSEKQQGQYNKGNTREIQQVKYKWNTSEIQQGKSKEKEREHGILIGFGKILYHVTQNEIS